jgi:hypothetical protein
MNSITRRVLLICILIGVFAMGAVVGQNKFGQPKSILHIITVKWKADATAADKQKAIDGIKVMAAKIPGITNVWLKDIKVQATDAVLVMEFKDQATFDAYAAHPAHKEWEGVYLPVREESRTHDVTN